MPSTAVIRAYEAVYILDPDAGEEKIAAITARYRGLIETQGGLIQKVDVWERRKLAYEIKGRNEGIYVVMQFTGTANVEVELRRVFQISEDQIRYMIVKLDEDLLAPMALSPAAPATESAPAPVAVSAPAAVAEAPPAAVTEEAPTILTEEAPAAPLTGEAPMATPELAAA